MKRTLIRALILSSSLLLTGCFNGGFVAPVTQAGTTPQRAPNTYRVRRGDTLYSIAWTYGLDYRALARTNHLSRHYQIWPGQTLVLKQQVTRAPLLASEKSSKNIHASVHYQSPTQLSWGWPVKGSIIQSFKPGYTGNAGVDIGGFVGEPVRAAAPGVVVYSGDGVRGYGNLIIIKHSDAYLSAYAFNRKNLVRVGSHVTKGQQVAVMGRNNAGRPALHFEIRQDGKPVNPMQYLG